MPGEVERRDVLAAVVDQVVVRLVGQDPEVALDAPLGERLELGAMQHDAGRVAWVAEDDHLGTRAGRRLQPVDVEVEVGGLLDEGRLGADHRGDIGVQREVRVWDQHLSPGSGRRYIAAKTAPVPPFVTRTSPAVQVVPVRFDSCSAITARSSGSPWNGA